jgi:hypothetical protein
MMRLVQPIPTPLLKRNFAGHRANLKAALENEARER